MIRSPTGLVKLHLHHVKVFRLALRHKHSVMRSKTQNFDVVKMVKLSQVNLGEEVKK